MLQKCVNKFLVSFCPLFFFVPFGTDFLDVQICDRNDHNDIVPLSVVFSSIIISVTFATLRSVSEVAR